MIHSADNIISYGPLRSVRIFRVIKIVRLEQSFNYLTPLRHVSMKLQYNYLAIVAGL